MTKHLNITISGRVQGVGFRYAARNIARNIGIKGYAKNLYNGNVFIEAEADEKSLYGFVDWCHKGPDHAFVEKVIVEPGENVFFESFDIRF